MNTTACVFWKSTAYRGIFSYPANDPAKNLITPLEKQVFQHILELEWYMDYNAQDSIRRRDIPVIFVFIVFKYNI